MSLNFFRCVRNACIALSLALVADSAALAAPPAEIPIDPNAAKASGWAMTDDGRFQVLVELTEPAAARAYAKVTLGKPTHDLRVLRAAATATQNSMLTISAQQAIVGTALSQVGAREIYRVARAVNGIAVAATPDQIAQIRKIPGVQRILPITADTPTLSTSVPFLGVPNVWGNTLGLPQGYTGTGIRIGIIDTGIDYIHADFGGSGLLTDYQANDTTVTDAFFPSAKVVGGTDLAGDAYTGSNSPTPDPDPMDCFGHGTHVAGIAAGFGVNADGSTYTGGYSNSTPFATLRIGPGVAPQALLYAIRIFGCAGSTALTVQGIDWALDPNGDNDFSDHLDVINMSLGSGFGDYESASSIASDNAALAGVIVVAAAGNSGDTYFIHGSPGASGRTISVAAISDSGNSAPLLTVNSPAAIAGGYAAGPAVFTPAPPDPSGQTASIVQALDAADAAGPTTTDGCSAFTNAAAVAGNIALIDQGTCTLISKVQNAQASGAIGAIIVGNTVGNNIPVAMGGTAPPGPAVTIPSIFITNSDGATIRAQLGSGVNATLSTATAGDTLASFSSRGPRLGAAPTRLKPDISAPGLNITSAQTGNTCVSGGCIVPSASGFISGSQALTISGTSMAAPHMAGVMALLRQEHPDWSVEQLKALAMNGALHDPSIGPNGSGLLYGGGRVGAGRVDPSDSAQASVVALNADDSGLVSVSFESSEVVGSATETKTVRLVNTGPGSATYDLSITTLVDAPGIAFSVPGASTVTVPGGASLDVDVQLDATSSLMTHARDATVAPTQTAAAPLTSLGNLSRHWITERSGFLVLSQGGTPKLRVPLYVESRPASTMAAPAVIPTGGAPTGSTTIPLSGSDVCTGTLSAGPTCTATFPNDEESLVTPFELQVISPQDETVAPAFADLQYGGVAYDPASNLIIFGVSTWGDWSTPTDVAFNIYIDNNSDGTYDRILFNTNPGTANASLFGTTNVFAQDSFVTLVFNQATSGVSVGNFVNRFGASSVDSVLFKTNVMFLAATPAQLGLTGGVTKFRYKIQTCPGSVPLCETISGFHYDEAAGPYTFDYAAQGLNFGGSILSPDLNGATLPVTWNTANMTTNGSLGALLLHHHNHAGQRAQTVALQGTSTLDLSIAQSVAPPSPNLGDNVTFTVTVTNNGPTAATGVAVTDSLPPGLTYVSDDASGAYSTSNGNWTVGSLAIGASAVLNIVATVDTTDESCNLAQITARSPIDTNPANDQATVCVMAPRSSDLALTMSVGSPTVVAGGNVTYTLNVVNKGSDTAYSLDVSNSFPAFASLHASSFTASQGVYNAATGLWNIGSMANGATAALTITVTAPNIAGALTNQGTASATTSDPNTANNSANATTMVLSPATLTATKTVSGTFTPTGTVTYTVVISNSSATDQQDNPGHEFTDTLPSTLTLVSANATSGTAVPTIASNNVTWDGSVPAGGSVTITITATINAGTGGQTIANQGTINYDADGNGTNEATTMTDDPSVAGTSDPTSFVVLSPATLTATKTVTGTFLPGGTVTYTVVINNGSTNAQLDNPGHEFTDILPAQLALVTANATSGTASTSGNTVNWDGSIASGSSVTITIIATVSGTAAGQSVINQGTVFFDADGNGTNESSVLTDNPALPGAADATSFVVAVPTDTDPVTTLDDTVLMLLAGMLALIAGLQSRNPATRRR